MTGNTSGQQATPAQAPPQRSLAERIQEIGALKGGKALKARAAGSRAAASVKKSAGEKVQRVKDALTGTKSELDYVRRYTRLTELRARYEGDPLMAGALAEAESAQAALPAVPPTGAVTDWGGPYVDAGLAADALLAAVDACAEQRRAAAENPSTKAVMGRLAGLQRKLDRRELTQAQYDSFSTTLRALTAEAVGSASPPDAARLRLVETHLDALQTVATLAMEAAATLLADLLARHTELSRHLAVSTLDDDARVSVAALLSAGDAAARAFDGPGATAKLDEAERMLGAKPATLPSAAALLAELEKPNSVKHQIGSLASKLGAGGQTPREAALLKQVWSLQTSTQSVVYMLEKGGDAVAGDARRMLDGLKRDYDKLAAASVFDNAAAGRIKGDAFAALCAPVERAASDFYAAAGAAAGYQGELHGKIDALKLRLAANAKAAGTEADLHYDELVKELDAVRQEIGRAAGGDKPSPDRLAYLGEVTRFNRLIRTLDEAAAPVLARDSDLALSLDLLGAPARLRRDGEQLAAAEPTADALGKAGVALKAVNTRIEAKLGEIAKLPPEAPPTAATLRSECERLKEAYAGRIAATQALIAEDAKKSFVTRSLKAEQLDGLKTFGSAVTRRLDMVAAPAAAGATDDKALLGDTRVALTRFEAEVAKFEQMGPGPKHVAKMKHFDDVTKLADEILKALGHVRFGPRGDVIEEWKATAEAAKKAPAKRDPDVVCGELATIKADVAVALKTAETEHGEASEEMKAIQRLADLIEVPSDEVVKRRIQQWGRAFDQFLRECEQAIETIRIADKPDTPAINRLKNRYDELTTGAETGLDALEAPALAAEQAYQTSMANLRQLIEVDIRLLREKADELGGEAGGQMAKQLDNARKAANSAIAGLKKTYDAKQADAMIDAITQRLRLLEDSPQGSRTNDRNHIGLVVKQWVAAVGAVTARLETVPKIVKDAVAAEDQATRDAAAALDDKLVKPILALFDPAAFDALVARMENGNEAAILDAREDGLAEVRRLRRVMLASPLVRLAGRNCPFPGAEVSFRPLENALMNLETNLNISDTVAA